MLDGLSLDQLRSFIAAVDEGSFSAASRRLHRAQSVISQTISNLEGQIGLALFDRSGRYPKLTAGGAVLLGDARSIVSGVDTLKARAQGMAGGLEPELSAVVDVFVDVFFPMQAITEAAKEYTILFPATPLRLYVEAIGATYQPVLDGRCSFGVVGPFSLEQPSLTTERLSGVEMVMVAARGHPLAAMGERIPRTELVKHVQLVLTDRSDLSTGREFGVMSPQTWRLADMFAKHAFLLNGLGWGGMPLHVVARDIAEGRLTTLSIEDVPPGALVLPMAAVYRTATPPGPAGRWLIERLKTCTGSPPSAASGRRP